VAPTTIDAVEEVSPPSSKRQRTAEQAVVDDLASGSAIVLVRRDDGSEYRFGDDELRGFLAVLAARARGQRVSIVAHELLLSPQKAASLLGVSRPMIYRYIETGELRASRVGSHWRLRAGDVVALARRRAEQAEAIDSGFAIAISEDYHHKVDAKRAWTDATDEERRFARELVSDLLDLDIDR
jgi:excisionase family DNA binding protein